MVCRMLADDTRTRPRREADALPPQRPRRADIQGLRAIAVVAVILDHLVRWPSGGFVGVDVFFVISGFLITGLLLREHETTGSISLRSFYLRRAKRILPASLLVLLVTVTAAFAVFNDSRAADVLNDAFWAALFSANWDLVLTGTDYFQGAGPVSPLQHYWSLAVEEQFYFVWPCLLLLVLLLTARRSRGVVAVVLAVLAAASFAFALWESAQSPATAYFSTASRVWELAVGALLAAVSPALRRIPDRLRPVLAWLGLLGIVASLFVITDAMPFPGPWAALPVLATAVVIAAGTGGPVRLLAPLTNRVSGYVGDISYSLYLWHFPVIVLATAFFAEGTALFLVVSVVLTAALSVASYHFLEEPIHRLPIAEGKAVTRSARAGRMGDWQHSYLARFRFGSLGLLGVLTVLLVAVALAPRVAPTASASPASASSSAMTSQELANGIETALQQDAWPALSPSLDEVMSGPQVPQDVTACGEVSAAPEEECSWGPADAERTMVLVGDSTSLAYTEAFREIADAEGWRVVTRAMFGCRFLGLTFANDNAALEAACPGRVDDAVAAIDRIKPDLVVISNSYAGGDSAATGKEVTLDEWSEALRSIHTRISSAASAVAVVTPPPSSKDVADCYTNLSTPADCVSIVSEEWTDFFERDSELGEELGVAVYDSRPWFCSGGMCPPFVGTTPMKLDATHITAEYARLIAPVIRSELARDELL